MGRLRAPFRVSRPAAQPGFDQQQAGQPAGRGDDPVTDQPAIISWAITRRSTTAAKVMAANGLPRNRGNRTGRSRASEPQPGRASAQNFAASRLPLPLASANHPATECGRSSGVEHNLAKVRVVSSNLIARSSDKGQLRLPFRIQGACRSRASRVTAQARSEGTPRCARPRSPARPRKPRSRSP
jgi:hypothetical protein